MADLSPLKIRFKVEHKGFHYKIIDHQKPSNLCAFLEELFGNVS